MEGISDIKIIGIDEMRPPRIRHEPYIDLYFKLNHKAPADWCNDFNTRAGKGKNAGKIEPSEGLFIETWVRTADEVEVELEKLKSAVETCSTEYVARIQAAARAAAESGGETPMEEEGEQGRLNRIIAALDFGDDS